MTGIFSKVFEKIVKERKDSKSGHIVEEFDRRSFNGITMNISNTSSQHMDIVFLSSIIRAILYELELFSIHQQYDKV